MCKTYQPSVLETVGIQLRSRYFLNVAVTLLLCIFGPQANAEDTQSQLASVNVDALATPSGAIAGAYYYPWYGVGNGRLEDDWRALLRQKLVPAQAPKLGFYRSDDPAVIGEHIRQSLNAGLSFWAVSWWGPQSETDLTFRDAILKHPDAKKLRYAVLYESTGRLGRLDEPHYENLISDFEYLAQQYFDDPNYLKIDGQPVVFVYLSRVYFRDRGLEELAALRAQLPQIYIIGDDVFGPNYQADWAKNFDAVTAYDVYGQSTKLHKATAAAIKTLNENYQQAAVAARSVGKAFVPTIAPGYNDRAVRRGNPGSARYLIDEEPTEEGSLFRAMIRDVALPNLDPNSGRLFMVTSFNEWYEDSQIEPTAGTAKPTTTDDSKSKKFFTGGDRYVDYGNLYLDILREELGRKPADN